MGEWFEKVVDLLEEGSSDLRYLAKKAGADPSRFYRGADLSGVDIRGQDLRGMDFTLANFTGAKYDNETKLEPEFEPVLAAQAYNDDIPARVEAITERIIERYIAERRHPPQPSKGYTQSAILAGSNITIRTGEYDDGTLAQLFIDMRDCDPTVRTLLRCIGSLVSTGLQYGIPLEEYVEEFVGTQFDPAGPVSGNDSVTSTTSVLDYVFRELAISYLSRTDLADVKIDQNPQQELERNLRIKANLEEAVARGYLSKPCDECGNFTLIKDSVTTLRCQTCGGIFPVS